MSKGKRGGSGVEFCGDFRVVGWVVVIAEMTFPLWVAQKVIFVMVVGGLIFRVIEAMEPQFF